MQGHTTAAEHMVFCGGRDSSRPLSKPFVAGPLIDILGNGAGELSAALNQQLARDWPVHSFEVTDWDDGSASGVNTLGLYPPRSTSSWRASGRCVLRESARSQDLKGKVPLETRIFTRDEAAKSAPVDRKNCLEVGVPGEHPQVLLATAIGARHRLDNEARPDGRHHRQPFSERQTGWTMCESAKHCWDLLSAILAWAPADSYFGHHQDCSSNSTSVSPLGETARPLRSGLHPAPTPNTGRPVCDRDCMDRPDGKPAGARLRLEAWSGTSRLRTEKGTKET